MTVRTRFAPSPTGYLHLGGVRTALFSWAYAKKMNGESILRIEDTDKLRSSNDAIQAIIDGLTWLGLDFDKGPFYQSERTHRYKSVVESLLEKGLAYFCYCSNEELNQMRELQKKRGEKPRYNGLWRPENIAKQKMTIPKNIKPVVRFKNPDSGFISWNDQVKGKISVNNSELDDLIILREDGSPTYNLTVVIDDFDMEITHVIRGDDHINNTPRQINILNALDAKIPVYAHLPMIHGPDGEKLSKRHGAVSVLQYKEEGYLPEALVNYLARLGWGHGDNELFSIKEFINWFSFSGCSKSASRFDFEKLKWVNSNYLKKTSSDELCCEISKRLSQKKINLLGGPPLSLVCELLIDRVQTLEELTNACEMFYLPIERVMNLSEIFKIEEYKKFSDTNKVILTEALTEFVNCFPSQVDDKFLNDHLQNTLSKFDLKMPQFAIPLRLILLGKSQTPSIIKVLGVFPRKIVCQRIMRALEK
mgnify:CR=1 FL=1